MAAGLGLVGLLLFAMRTRRRQAEPYAANHASTEGPASPQPTPLSVKRDIEPVRPIARRPEGLDDELLLTPQAEIPEVTDDDPPAFLVRPAAQAEDPEPLLLVSPVHDGVVGIQLRPWLEIQFKPDKATATATEATVQFNLIIANTGNAAASNIRVHARMFNAGLTLEQEIQDYFAAPIPESSAVIPTLSPRNATSMSSVVAMPKQLVREIEVQGRRLFIPTVAFNVSYEWGNGKTGRTSMSFLVGRESETPSSKMGPFRLDQGPRVYRQIGQRQSQPALLV